MSKTGSDYPSITALGLLGRIRSTKQKLVGNGHTVSMHHPVDGACRPKTILRVTGESSEACLNTTFLAPAGPKLPCYKNDTIHNANVSIWNIHAPPNPRRDKDKRGRAHQAAERRRCQHRFAAPPFLHNRRAGYKPPSDRAPATGTLPSDARTVGIDTWPAIVHPAPPPAGHTSGDVAVHPNRPWSHQHTSE